MVTSGEPDAETEIEEHSENVQNKAGRDAGVLSGMRRPGVEWD